MNKEVSQSSQTLSKQLSSILCQLISASSVYELEIFIFSKMLNLNGKVFVPDCQVVVFAVCWIDLNILSL